MCCLKYLSFEEQGRQSEFILTAEENSSNTKRIFEDKLRKELGLSHSLRQSSLQANSKKSVS